MSCVPSTTFPWSIYPAFSSPFSVYPSYPLNTYSSGAVISTNSYNPVSNDNGVVNVPFSPVVYGCSSVPNVITSGYVTVCNTGSLVSTSPSISWLSVVILYIKYSAPAFSTTSPVLVSFLYTCKYAFMCGSVITFCSNGSLLFSFMSMKNGLANSNPVYGSPFICTSSALSISITTYFPYANSADIASPFSFVIISGTYDPFASISYVIANACSGISYSCVSLL